MSWYSRSWPGTHRAEKEKGISGAGRWRVSATPHPLAQRWGPQTPVLSLAALHSLLGQGSPGAHGAMGSAVLPTPLLPPVDQPAHPASSSLPEP